MPESRLESGFPGYVSLFTGPHHFSSGFLVDIWPAENGCVLVGTVPPKHCVPSSLPLGLFLQQNDGRLRLSRQGIIFKNSKTGKVDNIQAGELTEGIWRRVALGHGLKLLTKNGHVYKYDGFRESVRCLVAINPLLWCHLI